MINNEYINSEECLFIQYHDIIKSFKPYLLTRLLYNEDYRKGYDYCIDFDMFKDYSDSQLLGLVVKSIDKNILKTVMKVPFNYHACMSSLYTSFPDMFSESKHLAIGSSIHFLLKQKYVTKIYIHTEIYDRRIHEDIQNSYQDMNRINYITGDFIDAVNSVEEKITTFIINDIKLVDGIINAGKAEYTNILIADCGWNYKKNKEGKAVLDVDGIEEKMKKYIFKSGTFRVDKNIIY